MTISVIDVDTVTQWDTGIHTITVSTVASSGASSTDHGSLAGLADDDHPQYFTISRGDARYMETLLYDPSGKRADVFNLTNQTGSLDAGQFT